MTSERVLSESEWVMGQSPHEWCHYPHKRVPGNSPAPSAVRAGEDSRF